VKFEDSEALANGEQPDPRIEDSLLEVPRPHGDAVGDAEIVWEHNSKGPPSDIPDLGLTIVHTKKAT
jgi:hypothetical protein